MLLRYRVKIPLVGRPASSQKPKSSVKERSPLWHALRGTYTRSDWRRHITDIWKRTDAHVSVKPGRTLGAVYMDDAIAQRLGVSLCPDCVSRYGWRALCRAHTYKVVWHPKELTDCAGCGAKHVYCTGFWPQEHPTPWASHWDGRTKQFTAPTHNQIPLEAYNSWSHQATP